jgi:hypothetical protein
LLSEKRFKEKCVASNNIKPFFVKDCIGEIS